MKLSFSFFVISALLVTSAPAWCAADGGKDEKRLKPQPKASVAHAGGLRGRARSLKSNPRPAKNIGYLLSGYDVFKGNPTPTKSESVAGLDPGFKIPIFAAEYHGQETTPDGRYLVPDGIHTRSATSCSHSFVSKEVASAKSYQDELSIRAKVSGQSKLFGAKFTASSDYKKVEKGSSEGSHVFMRSEASCSKYKADISRFNGPWFAEGFLNGLDTLPTTYSGNERSYLAFIQEYGTHYVKSLTMGALFGEQSTITSDAWVKMKSRSFDIEASASASAFGSSLSASAARQTASKDVEQFRENTVERAIYSQGARPPADGKIENWEIDDPAPIEFVLHPIYELDFPPSVSQDIKANLERAINEDYCKYLMGEGELESCQAPRGAPPARPNSMFIYGLQYNSGRKGFVNGCVHHRPGRDVTMANCVDADSRKWAYYPETKEVKSLVNDECLSWAANQGNNLVVRPCNGHPYQKFVIEDKGGPFGKFLLKADTDRGMCMDVSTKSRNNVQMFKCHGGNNQEFYRHNPNI